MEPSLVKWSWALRVLRWIDARVFRSWRCSVCGCTDHFACAEGCGWCFAAPGARIVCTACALADPSLVMVEREHRIAKLERELPRIDRASA